MAERTLNLEAGLQLEGLPNFTAPLDLVITYDNSEPHDPQLTDIRLVVDGQDYDASWLLFNAKANDMIHTALYEHELNESISARDRAYDLRREAALDA